MSWHTSRRYGHVILVSGYPVLTAVNWQCGLAKTRLRHPSLPFGSLSYPTLTICRRVRTYARSVTWQPNEKRLTIFYEYGALSHARFARVGAPLLIKIFVWWGLLIVDLKIVCVLFIAAFRSFKEMVTTGCTGRLERPWFLVIGAFSSCG